MLVVKPVGEDLVQCPYCRVEFHDNPVLQPVDDDSDGRWTLVKQQCPRCGKINLQLGFHRLHPMPNGQKAIYNDKFDSIKLVKPKVALRPPPPIEVPKILAADYSEACIVIADSPKASAALSRRCLQHILREKAGVKNGDLADEIQQVIESGKLPTTLAESLDAIRVLGNFAAHPIKSKRTGEIVDVLPGEAEWTLDVIEALFDFYYVQPEILKKKRSELNTKLGDAGKPPMK